MTRFLVAVAHDAWPGDHPAEYVLCDEASPEDAVMAVKLRLFGDDDLAGTDVIISVVPFPEQQPVPLLRLADMTRFELEMLIRLPVTSARSRESTGSI